MRTTTFARLSLVGVAVAACLYLTTRPLASGINLQATDSAFTAYMAKYGKSYLTKEEYEYRRDLFNENMAFIAEQNSQNGMTYRLAPNKFSDMSEYELQNSLGAVRPMPSEDGSEWAIEPLEAPEGTLLAGAVDWTSIMNPVRDQGNCGSCWAFATIASVEGRWAIKRQGEKLALSEQQLVDCSAQNQGCNGGWPSKAFTFLKVYGAQDRTQYPYNAFRGACKF